MQKTVKKIVLSLLIFFVVFISTSYAAKLWIKTLKVEMHLGKGRLAQSNWFEPNANLVENVTFIDYTLTCPNQQAYCTISDVQVNEGNSVLIFGISFDNINENYNVYPEFEVSIYNKGNNTIIYGIAVENLENCEPPTTLEGTKINLCKIKENITPSYWDDIYGAEFKIDKHLSEGDKYYLYFYFPEIIDPARDLDIIINVKYWKVVPK